MDNRFRGACRAETKCGERRSGGHFPSVAASLSASVEGQPRSEEPSSRRGRWTSERAAECAAAARAGKKTTLFPLRPPPRIMYQDYPGNFDTSSRGSSGSPAHAESYSSGGGGQQLSPEEEEKRRIRRERNKLAAAKCRNRRRELTEKLQAETEELEEEKSGLQKEIAELQKEKEKLEFMLVAHGPVCKISPEERRSPPTAGLQPLRGTGGAVVVKQEPLEEDSPSSSAVGMDKTQRSVIKPISIAGGGFYGEEPLHTPIVVTSTPAITPGTSNLVFTYPSVLEQESPASPSESCSKAHRRSSSSGDQSSDSLNSPTLLAL